MKIGRQTLRRILLAMWRKKGRVIRKFFFFRGKISQEYPEMLEMQGILSFFFLAKKNIYYNPISKLYCAAM